MSAIAYIATAVVLFVLLVGALGLLPVLLCVSAARSTVPRRSRRLRVMQSNIAMLAVLAVVGVYLGVSRLLTTHGGQPLFLAVAAAAVVIAPTSLITYVQLERQVPRGN